MIRFIAWRYGSMMAVLIAIGITVDFLEKPKCSTPQACAEEKWNEIRSQNLKEAKRIKKLCDKQSGSLSENEKTLINGKCQG